MHLIHSKQKGEGGGVVDCSTINAAMKRPSTRCFIDCELLYFWNISKAADRSCLILELASHIMFHVYTSHFLHFHFITWSNSSNATVFFIELVFLKKIRRESRRCVFLPELQVSASYNWSTSASTEMRPVAFNSAHIYLAMWCRFRSLKTIAWILNLSSQRSIRSRASRSRALAAVTLVRASATVHVGADCACGTDLFILVIFY